MEIKSAAETPRDIAMVRWQVADKYDIQMQSVEVK